jgi:hypothetical protein
VCVHGSETGAPAPPDAPEVLPAAPLALPPLALPLTPAAPLVLEPALPDVPPPASGVSLPPEPPFVLESEPALAVVSEPLLPGSGLLLEPELPVTPLPDPPLPIWGTDDTRSPHASVAATPKLTTHRTRTRSFDDAIVSVAFQAKPKSKDGAAPSAARLRGCASATRPARCAKCVALPTQLCAPVICAKRGPRVFEWARAARAFLRRVWAPATG